MKDLYPGELSCITLVPLSSVEIFIEPPVIFIAEAVTEPSGDT